MLAARVIANHVDRVTVIERDDLPPRPAPRKGLPQARHAHLLWSGGARVIETLLPGVMADLTAAGARRVGIPTDTVLLSTEGWLRRGPECQFLMACSRDLLDWVIRQHVVADTRVTLQEATDVVGLLGDDSRVVGVRTRGRDTEVVSEVVADYVIDATGRGSQADRWLVELGLPAVREEVVDAGVAYASREYRAPDAAGSGFPIINVQPNPRDRRPGCGAGLLPIEGGRWLVTLTGTRGGEPPTDEDAFVAFAGAAVRHPLVADLIAHAQPSGPIYGSHSTANRRRRYERMTRWPDRFVVMGDAVAIFNPVYGHGMSVAALAAAAIGDGLRANGLDRSARRIQRVVARSVEGAWVMATGQDIRYPEAVGPPQTRVDALIQRYVNRLTGTAIERPHVMRALFDAFSLSAPMTRLITPAVALSTLLGPRHPPLAETPLTLHEAALLGNDIRPTSEPGPDPGA